MTLSPSRVRRRHRTSSHRSTALRALCALLIVLSAAACDGDRPARPAGGPLPDADHPPDSGLAEDGNATGSDGATGAGDGDATPVLRTFDDPDHGSDACLAIAAGPDDSIVVA